MKRVIYSEFSDSAEGSTTPILTKAESDALKADVEAITSDGIITVSEKVKTFLPTVTELDQLSSRLITKAASLSINSSALSTAKTNFVNYLNTLSPVYNSLVADTPVNRTTLNNYLSAYTDEIAVLQTNIQGQPGATGTPGTNVAVVYLYQRSGSTPSKPTGALTYTFSTSTLSGTMTNGWSTTIPAGTSPLYVIAATANSTTNTDSIAGAEWSTPVVLAQDGSTGAAGLNSATVYLYQRATSAPAVPSADITYTFSTGAVSGLTNGWTKTIPAGTNPIYVTFATAAATTATDTITSAEWSSPQVLAQNGANGAAALTVLLSNEAHTVASDAAGNVLSYTGASGTIQVLLGTSDVTSGCTFALAANPQTLFGPYTASSPLNTSTGAYSVTGGFDAVEDSATLDIQVTHTTSGLQIVKRFSLGKSKTGATGATGASAKTLKLSVDSQVMKYDTAGTVVSGQVSTFTVAGQNLSSTTKIVKLWRINGDGSLTQLNAYSFLAGSGSITGPNVPVANAFTMTGNTITLTAANFAASEGSSPHLGLIVEVSHADGVSDTVSIHRVRDGSNALTGYLTNESHTLPADKDGNNVNYTGATSQFEVLLGTTNVTSGCTFSAGSYSGIDNATLSVGGLFTLLSVTADAGYYNIVALHTASGQTITKKFTFSKSKAGVNAKTVSVSATSQIMKFDRTDKVVDGQTVTVTANRQNISTATTWLLRRPSDGSSFALTGYASTAGDTLTITSAQFAQYITDVTAAGLPDRSLIVEATSEGYIDRVTIAKVSDAGSGAWTPVRSSGMAVKDTGFVKIDTGGTWNSSVYSKEKIKNAKVSFRVPTINYTMFGLDENPGASAGYDTIRHAIYFQTTSFIPYIYEEGAGLGYVGVLPAAGDVFTVEQREDVVFYTQNGNVVYVSTTLAPDPLGIDSSFLGVNGEVADVTFGVAPDLPDFFEPGFQGLSKSGSNYVKTTSSAGWGTAGLVSARGYAGAQFNITGPTTTAQNIMFGLRSSRTLSKVYTSITYAIYLNDSAQIVKYIEGGNYGVIGTWAASDKFTFRHDGTVVTVLQNNVAITTFAGIDPATVFYAMVDLNTYGGDFSNLSFYPAGSNGTRPDIKFIRSAAQPATPTGDSPAGWSDGVPSGNGRLWSSRATKTYTGKLVGVWTVPQSLNDLVTRGPYSSTTTYYPYDTVTYNGGTYINLVQTVGNAPTGTAEGNAYWDVLAAPGVAGAPSTPPSGFTTTINLTSGANVNLRTVANAAGYPGGDATITFNVPSGVTIRGLAGGGKGIDTGSWPSGYTIALTLVVQNGGIVDGGGGNGGEGGFGNGGAGGDAIYVNTSKMTGGITINSGGIVRGGGGGGAGASATAFTGGAGGGGGAPNGLGGVGGYNEEGVQAASGSAGTTSGGGSPRGGGYGTAGTASGLQTGGAAGYAVRKNGYTCTVTNNGTMTGTSG